MGYIKHNVLAPNQISNGDFHINPVHHGWANVGTGWTWNKNAQNMSFTSADANLTTNGTFTGNANSWTLGSQWTYGSNKIAHAASVLNNDYDDSNTISQTVSIESNAFYVVSFTVSNFVTAGFMGVSIGNKITNTESPPGTHTLVYPVLSQRVQITANGQYTVLVKAGSDDSKLYLQAGGSATSGVFSIDDVVLTDARYLQQDLSASEAQTGFFASMTVNPSVGKAILAILYTEISNNTLTLLQGMSGTIGDSGLRFTSMTVYVVASKNFSGTVDDVALTLDSNVTPHTGTAEPSTPVDQPLATYRLQLEIGGTTGTVTIFGQEYNAGSGFITYTFTDVIGEGNTFEITPSGDFNGTIDRVSLKTKLTATTYGPELITNGSFNGGSSGWTLNLGWEYVGENEASLPDYTTSLSSVVTRVDQNLPFPRFVFGGLNESGTIALFKKSETYGFHVWRSPVYQIGTDFDVVKITFNTIPRVDEDSDIKIIPVLYFDNESRQVVGNDIDSSHGYGSFIQLNAKNFNNQTHGKYNFFFELQLVGDVLVVVTLPIIIEIDSPVSI